VNSRHLISILRWLGAAALLAGIVSLYHWVIQVNATTVALTLLLFILFLAAKWGLRYAIVTSIVATLCYNFFFLPPFGTLTISDPQNLLALIVFLITSVFASRLSDRIRDESLDAQARQAELEVLYRLSRVLLQTDELAQVANSIPSAVALATGSTSILFYLLEEDKIYRAGTDALSTPSLQELQQLSNAPAAYLSAETRTSVIPLRSGVRPRGVLMLHNLQLSSQTLEALGGLVSVSLDRARAMDDVTRAEAAKESERLRSLMLDSITHELRTPLTAIKASVSTLLTSQLPVEESRDLLTVIEEESDRLNRLIAQAVEMAQLETQEVSMNFSPQSVGRMMETALASSAPALAEHPVHVTLPDSLPMVNADPVWMQRLFANLLENAAKYSAAGQPIFVVAESKGQSVTCSVADRGVGIEPMEQALIFDKFYRSPNRNANVSGTGMGLAICRAIIEAHHGTISVTSQPHQGSVFTVTLPVE